MCLRGKLTELMVKIEPELYQKYIIINSKGETVLYVYLLNALYGIMQAAATILQEVCGQPKGNRIQVKSI